jgi:hypothetical protein
MRGERVASAASFGFAASSAATSRSPSSRRVLALPAMRGGQARSRCSRFRSSRPSTSSTSLSEGVRPNGGAGWLIASAPESVLRTSTTPVMPPWRRTGRGSRLLSTACAASVAWPTKGASLRGVKKRTCTSSPALAGGSTKAVSPLFNSRAMACISAGSSCSACSTTPAGLPVKGVSVNASTWNTCTLRIAAPLVCIRASGS